MIYIYKLERSSILRKTPLCLLKHDLPSWTTQRFDPKHHMFTWIVAVHIDFLWWFYWLVVWTPLKNISQWEGLSHILWKKMFETTNQFMILMLWLPRTLLIPPATNHQPSQSCTEAIPSSSWRLVQLWPLCQHREISRMVTTLLSTNLQENVKKLQCITILIRFTVLFFLVATYVREKCFGLFWAIWCWLVYLGSSWF